MGLSGGYAAGAGANALQDLLKQKFLEQIENRRASEQQQQFGQNQQRIDTDALGQRQEQGRYDTTRSDAIEATRVRGVAEQAAKAEQAAAVASFLEGNPHMRGVIQAQGAGLNISDPTKLESPQQQAQRAEAAAAAGLRQKQAENDITVGGQLKVQSAGHQNAVRLAQTRQPTGLSPNQTLTQTRALQGSYNKIMAPSRDMQRQLSAMDAGLAEAQKGNLNAGSQAVLMTFQKILDPSSVVRETEYDRTPQGMGLMQQMEGILPRLVQGGPGVPPAELAKFADLARQITAGAVQSAQTNAQGIIDLANANGIDPKLVTGSGGGGGGATGTSGGGPKAEQKAIPGVPGGVAEMRNGKWVRVK
jgi:hypothetical protein